MAASEKIKALLVLRGRKNIELAAHFGISPQSMNNKLSRDSFSVKDLVKVADFVGGRVAVILDNGQTVFFDSEETDAKTSAEG